MGYRGAAMRPRAIPGALALLVMLCATAAASAAQPLETAVFPEPSELAGHPAAFERVVATGATKVRLLLDWRKVAPAKRQAGFKPGDPADPAYRWAAFDRQVVQATQAGLDPIVTVFAAPTWAAGKADSGAIATRRPNAAQFGLFAQAAARRYSGSFNGLPRVRYWMAWNEPNLYLFLNPQTENGRQVASDIYRRLLNSFGAAVHAVDASNVVVGGGLAPFSTPPLEFMRDLFCLRRDLRPKCRTKVELDVWSHHPYTQGGPTHSAFGRDNVTLGDLPEMRAVLRAAERHGMIRGARRPAFWVTEFSWDTKPSDRGGVPVALHAMWVSEALYRMWRSGVSLVTWFRIEDQPTSAGPFQSGLYFDDGRAKPALRAFRFPFVALRGGGGIFTWGRVPTSAAADVRVERKVSGRWVAVASLQANSFGIFQKRLALPATAGPFRARVVGGELSRPFDPQRKADLRVNAFGDQ